jgi:hypothetical protein
MLVLHLHQHQSSRNLHLQYLAKNQSTPCCQSLIRPGSYHPSVLEPQMALNLPLDECIDNTLVLVIKDTMKRKETTQRNSNKRSKAKEGKQQDHLKRTSLRPFRQGQRLDTSKTKHAQVKSTNHQSKAQKNAKSSPCAHARSP